MFLGQKISQYFSLLDFLVCMKSGDCISDCVCDVITHNNGNQSVVKEQEDTPCFLFPVRQGRVRQGSERKNIIPVSLLLQTYSMEDVFTDHLLVFLRRVEASDSHTNAVTLKCVMN